MASGVGFTPRLDPRPQPLNTSEVLRNAIVHYIRFPLLTAAACQLAYPIYTLFVNIWMTQQWSERSFFMATTVMVHEFFYWGQNSVFLLFDRRRMFERYKLNRTPAMGPTEELIQETWKEAIVGHCVVGPITLYFVYDLIKYFGMPAMEAELPGFVTLFGFFLASTLINEVGFYFSHRLVHSKPLYTMIHKKHHVYKGSIGFAAEHATPLEQIFSNQLPTFGACLFFGSHNWIWLVWLACRLQQTYEAHSGYCFHGSMLHKIGLTNSEAAAYHDYHHTGNRGNFGSEMLDHFFGTHDAWLKLGGTQGYIAAKKPGGNVLNNDFRAKAS